MPIDHDADRKTRPREAIAAHLESHPRAGATPEGIIASWLPARGYEDAILHIGEVLDAMVKSGELVARPLPDGVTLYVSAGTTSPANSGEVKAN